MIILTITLIVRIPANPSSNLRSIFRVSTRKGVGVIMISRHFSSYIPRARRCRPAARAEVQIDARAQAGEVEQGALVVALLNRNGAQRAVAGEDEVVLAAGLAGETVAAGAGDHNVAAVLPGDGVVAVAISTMTSGPDVGLPVNPEASIVSSPAWLRTSTYRKPAKLRVKCLPSVVGGPGDSDAGRGTADREVSAVSSSGVGSSRLAVPMT